MPLATLLLGLTLLQDPDGFRVCKNSCPVPTHKTPREVIQQIVPSSSSALPGADSPAGPAMSGGENATQNNAELGEIIKRALLDTVTVKEAKAAKPEPKTLTIFFPFNSAAISGGDEKRIFQFISDRGDLAMGEPDGEHYMKLYVTGYTDSKGSKPYNEVLARKRAHAVEKVLKKREYNNVFVEAKGKCCYADPNTEAAKNRRVEIRAEGEK